jgi:muramidase (phage lysozyme)
MATITSTEAGGENFTKFLDLISFSEGAAYDTIVTGVDGPATFTDFSTHPFANGRPPVVIRREPLLESTAAGRYQLLARYWSHYRDLLRLPDYSPLSQDRVALQQIKECGADQDIRTGEIAAAIAKCSNIWASFPGNGYGQGGKTVTLLLEHYATL